MKKLAKTALVGSLIVAGTSPFAMNAMAQGYQNQDAKSIKCAKSDKKCTKKAEAKCGEGKCGGASTTTTTKKVDGKCGEGKCGGSKTTEAKCGEGKCGGSK